MIKYYSIFVIALFIHSCSTGALRYQTAQQTKKYAPPPPTKPLEDTMLVPQSAMAGELLQTESAGYPFPIAGFIQDVQSENVSMQSVLQKKIVIAEVGINSRNQPSLRTELPPNSVLKKYAAFTQAPAIADATNSSVALLIDNQPYQLAWSQTLENVYIVIKSADGTEYADAIVSKNWLTEFAQFLQENPL